jgi:hypothetical protein
MSFMAYYLRRARRAREKADIEPHDAYRRAWIEIAEIIEARCLLLMSQDTDRYIDGNTSLPFSDTIRHYPAPKRRQNPLRMKLGQRARSQSEGQ